MFKSDVNVESTEEKKVIVMGDEDVDNLEADELEEDVDPMYVKFSKPYLFDEDTYDGIDLSCLDKLNAKDLVGIEKKYYKLGIASFNPENTTTYAKFVAQKASGLPMEFFEWLPLNDMMKIKNRVVSFFYN